MTGRFNVKRAFGIAANVNQMRLGFDSDEQEISNEQLKLERTVITAEQARENERKKRMDGKINL